MIAEAVALVTFASLLFSLDYMREERAKLKFFALMIFFSFSMELFLFAQDWLTLFLSWEIMSLCSYMLIGFYDTKRARKAARKAIVLTRVGSASLLLAMGYIYAVTGSLRIGTVPPLAAILIFIAALSKASQFPFSWLPDAMEAPTPASALLHAATMVNAGPILLFKLSPSFRFLQPFIFFSSFISLVLASLSALQENNLKRILAYSTVASLAILFTLFDSPLFIPFFLIHAFSKASLFFIGGELAKHRGYELEMDYSRKSLQAFLFLFFSLSIAGFPPFGAFWIKASELSAFSLLSFILSLAYFLRAYFYIFAGNRISRAGLGTLSSLLLLPFSVLPTLPLLTANFLAFAAFIALAPSAYFLTRFEPFFDVFSKVFNIPECVDLHLHNFESLIDRSIYRAGVRMQRLSLVVRRLFTGPVSRDVAYIGLALLFLMLGVILSQT